MSDKATLQEIDNHWSMVDVLIGNELLDYQAELNEENARRQR